jgi:hypothetical protein
MLIITSWDAYLKIMSLIVFIIRKVFLMGRVLHELPIPYQQSIAIPSITINNAKNHRVWEAYLKIMSLLVF